MARWSDLPVELKDAIIGYLGKSEDVEEGERDSVDFQALLALSQVERATYFIARPYLWKRIDISTRSRKSIQQFAQAVLPSSRPFISHVVCYRRFDSTYEEEVKTSIACGILISLAPSTKSLFLGVGDWPAALPDDLLASLEQLNVEEDNDPVKMELDNYFTAETVRRCPNLRILVCDSYDRQGLKELYDRIRRLKFFGGYHFMGR